MNLHILHQKKGISRIAPGFWEKSSRLFGLLKYPIYGRNVRGNIVGNKKKIRLIALSTVFQKHLVVFWRWQKKIYNCCFLSGFIRLWLSQLFRSQALVETSNVIMMIFLFWRKDCRMDSLYSGCISQQWSNICGQKWNTCTLMVMCQKVRLVALNFSPPTFLASQFAEHGCVFCRDFTPRRKDSNLSSGKLGCFSHFLSWKCSKTLKTVVFDQKTKPSFRKKKHNITHNHPRKTQWVGYPFI